MSAPKDTHTCWRCSVYKRDLTNARGDLGDRKKKLIHAQTHAANHPTATNPDNLAAIAEEARHLRDHIKQLQLDYEAHQADEHPNAAKPPPFQDLSHKNSPAHRLTDEQRHEIKLLLADGVPRGEIAEAFGISVSAVQYYAIRSGHSRIDAPPPPPKPTPALGLVFNTLPWADNALCAQTDPEAFYPEKGGSTSEAKAICRTCTVAAECLDTALANDERHGIWGGLSERERRHIKQALTSTNTTKE